jgi:hypothetical protein
MESLRLSVGSYIKNNNSKVIQSLINFCENEPLGLPYNKMTFVDDSSDNEEMNYNLVEWKNYIQLNQTGCVVLENHEIENGFSLYLIRKKDTLTIKITVNLANDYEAIQEMAKQCFLELKSIFPEPMRGVLGLSKSFQEYTELSIKEKFSQPPAEFAFQLTICCVIKLSIIDAPNRDIATIK